MKTSTTRTKTSCTSLIKSCFLKSRGLKKCGNTREAGGKLMRHLSSSKSKRSRQVATRERSMAQANTLNPGQICRSRTTSRPLRKPWTPSLTIAKLTSKCPRAATQTACSLSRWVASLKTWMNNTLKTNTRMIWTLTAGETCQIDMRWMTCRSSHSIKAATRWITAKSLPLGSPAMPDKFKSRYLDHRPGQLTLKNSPH